MDGALIGRESSPSPLVEAYLALGRRLEPFMAVLNNRIEQVNEAPEQQQTHESMVIAAVDDLIALSRDQALPGLAGAAQVADARLRQLMADPRSLEGSFEDLEISCKGWETVVGGASSTMDMAIRVLAARGVIASKDVQRLSRRLVAVEKAHRKIDRHIRREVMAGRYLHRIVDVELRDLARHPDDSTIGERWRARVVALRDCQQAVSDHGRRLQQIRRNAQRAINTAVAAQMRLELEDRQRQQQRQQESRARRQAEEEAAASVRVDDLARRANHLHAQLVISSSQLRERGWGGLFKRLVNGMVVDEQAIPGIPREQARSVLGLVNLIASLQTQYRSSGEAAAQLRALLDAEEQLMAEQQALGEAIGRLPIGEEVRLTYVGIRPQLRSAYEWVSANWEQVRPLLEVDVPEEAGVIGRVLDKMRSTAATEIDR